MAVSGGVIAGVVVGVVVVGIIIAVVIYFFKCRDTYKEPRSGDGHVIGNLSVLEVEDKKRVNGLQNSQRQPNDGEMIIMNPAALEFNRDDGYKKHSSGLAYQVGDNRDIVSNEPTVFVNTSLKYEKEQTVSESLRRAEPYQETDNTAVISNVAVESVNVRHGTPKETSF